MSRHKYLLLGFFFMALFGPLGAQELLFEKDVARQQQRNNDEREFGVNGKHHTERSFGFGWILPAALNDSLAIETNAQSTASHLSMRYRRKLCGWLALGTELRLQRSSFLIQQHAQRNLLAMGMVLDRQKLVLNTLHLAPFIRVFYHRRGILRSKYIDVGIDLAHVYYNRLVNTQRPNLSTSPGAKKTRTSFIQNDFVERNALFATVRWHPGRLSMALSYRLNNMFKPSLAVRNGETAPNLSPLFLALEYTYGKRSKRNNKWS
jgi:hypothetical protein